MVERVLWLVMGWIEWVAWVFPWDVRVVKTTWEWIDKVMKLNFHHIPVDITGKDRHGINDHCYTMTQHDGLSPHHDGGDDRQEYHSIHIKCLYRAVRKEIIPHSMYYLIISITWYPTWLNLVNTIFVWSFNYSIQHHIAHHIEIYMENLPSFTMLPH